MNWLTNIWETYQKGKKYEELAFSFAESEKEVKELKQSLNSLTVKNHNLEQKVPKKHSVNDAKYWNEKWKQSTIWYSAPKRKKVVNYVKYRNIQEISNIASLLISTNNDLRNNKDGVILTVLKWLDKQKFKYKLDKGEIWYSPEEFLNQKYGDCDDFAIFEYYLIREMFKQLNQWGNVKHRLKCIAGNVNRRSSLPSSAGGHFYLNWLHSDGEWYTVESTYYRKNAINAFGKTPQKLNSMYGTIWFSFNEKYSWSQHSISVSKEDFRK